MVSIGPESIKTREFTVSPGAITAAAGYHFELDSQSVPLALYRPFAVIVDARQATTDVKIRRGDQEHTIEAGAADSFEPGGFLDRFSITPDANVADGDVRLILRCVWHDHAGRFVVEAASRRF